MTTDAEVPTPEQSEQREQPSDAANRILAQTSLDVPCDKLLDLLVAQSTQQVSDKLREGQVLTWRRAAVIVAIVAALGAGGIFSVRSELARNFETFENTALSTIQEDITTETMPFVEQLRFETTYQEFISLSVSLTAEDRPGFGRGELDAVMAILRQLREQEGSLVLLASRRAFPHYLGRVVVALDSARVHDEIREIDNLFREVLLSHPAAVASMANHYGTLVIGSPLPFNSQPEATMDGLMVYSNEAKTKLYPELYILWHVLREFQQNDYRSNETTDNLIASVESLNEQDQNSLHELLTRLSNPESYVIAEVGGEERTLANKIGRLLDAYPQLEAAVKDADRFGLPVEMQNGAGWSLIDTIQGSLPNNGFEEVAVSSSIVEGRDYRFVGACDEACRDMDLVLQVNGDEVDEDYLLDSEPVVEFVAGASDILVLGVSMPDCQVSSCEYAIGVFERVQ